MYKKKVSSVMKFVSKISAKLVRKIIAKLVQFLFFYAIERILDFLLNYFFGI
ncbi:hypothetical protein J6TS7_23080 [Paenibacillus dendritiformis]|nr:hypothetical protein J6TS7_23080 [Paenibacillus dendritiformis]